MMLIGATEAAASPPTPPRGGPPDPIPEDVVLDRALQGLVALPGGPPGVIAIVQRGDRETIHSFGTREVGTERRPDPDDPMRIASVSKAFGGAAALALVQRGRLGLDDTIGGRRPDLPLKWHAVTLRQLLSHTSGVPSFTAGQGYQDALSASATVAPAPRKLLDFVADQDLSFPPGSRYEYSNSENVIAGLFVEAVTGRSLESQLQRLVYGPLGLRSTSLPAGVELPGNAIRGYRIEPGMPPEDVSLLLAGRWSWAAGGMVSTPADLNRFIRGYVGGALFGRHVQEAQTPTAPGDSDPVGPGTNMAGLALYRFDTRCGSVYGHTGNIFGYTQFAAASRDGSQSVTVSINIQSNEQSEGQAAAVFTALRAAEVDAVCAALAPR